jgi:acyl carrier protein
MQCRIRLMDDVRERLMHCFIIVFLALAPSDAVVATIDTVPAWDSGHHFMLVQVIEENFDIHIPEDVLAEIDSFDGFACYLARHVR